MIKNLINYNFSIKPILETFLFELKKQWKKFVFFLVISIIVVFLQSFLLNTLISTNLLPDTQSDFFRNGLGFLSLLILFSGCLFFAGIICEEFKTKTGNIVFPKINKYKLIVGKYLGNLVYIVIIMGIYYFMLGLLGFYYYGGPINIRIYYSFGFALLYLLAISSFVTFFSSFMRSPTITIVVTILLLLIGFNIADSIVIAVAPDFETIYSLTYMGNLITSILINPFPDPRYIDLNIGEFTIRSWITPSVEMGITILLLYTFICMILASYLFKRRQL
ncbi:MAG: ABC transporter permease [Promethearchaeota archaeon]